MPLDLAATGFLAKKPYNPPSWASHLSSIPANTISLAHLPTPIHKWNLPNLPPNTEVWLKRDDLSGMQLSGNKVRKLEFLMEDAVAKGADCIITIGAVQSNHCCATAVAAKYLNLNCYLILITTEDLVDKDPGLSGTLLVERLTGAHIDLITLEEYIKFGGMALCNMVKERLISEGKRPYAIPTGGSNCIGTWSVGGWMVTYHTTVLIDKVVVADETPAQEILTGGHMPTFYRGYIETIREIEQQLLTLDGPKRFDDIVAACGTGGTVTGLSLGSWLSSVKAKVHGFHVSPNPKIYDQVQELIDGLNASLSAHDIVNIQRAVGMGYGINTAEELKFIKEVASSTGVVLDPVYSGKAAFGLMKDMAEHPKKWEGRKVLFIHTGGLLGLYGKLDRFAPLAGDWRKMSPSMDGQLLG